MGSQANIYIDKGTNFSLDIELFDASDNELDLVNTTFHGDIRKLYSTKRVAEFEITHENNVITLKLSPDVTSLMVPGKYQYDVLKRLLDSEGQTVNITKVVEGILFVVSTVTEV